MATPFASQKAPGQSQGQREIRIPKVSSESLGLVFLGNTGKRSQVNMDIVAIHGIGADRDATWQYKSRNKSPAADNLTSNSSESPSQKPIVDWLADNDMLPKEFPTARIMRFGYDSTWFGENAVKQRVDTVAHGLLDELCHEREGCHSRPVIFIGHCFGGLVMQKAYNLATANREDWPGIADFSFGFVFMGTPHRGTSGTALHSQGAIYQAIAAYKMKTETGMLNYLEAGNDTLDSVRSEFTRLVRVSKTKTELFCFFEQKETCVGIIVGDKTINELVVGESWATLDGARRRGLPLDHFNLNKFQSATDMNYKYVVMELKKMLKSVTNLQMPAMRSTQEDQRNPLFLLEHEEQVPAPIPSSQPHERTGEDPRVSSGGVPRLMVIPKDKAKAHELLIEVAKLGDLETIQALIEGHGCDPAWKDSQGRGALSWAAGEGKAEMVEWLHGIVPGDLDKNDENNAAPLMYAASEGHHKVVEFLLSQGVAKDAKNHEGNTPLQSAIKNLRKQGPRTPKARAYSRVIELLTTDGKMSSNPESL